MSLCHIYWNFTGCLVKLESDIFLWIVGHWPAFLPSSSTFLVELTNLLIVFVRFLIITIVWKSNILNLIGFYCFYYICNHASQPSNLHGMYVEYSFWTHQIFRMYTASCQHVVLVVKNMLQVSNVAGRQPQSVQLGQLGVRGNPGQCCLRIDH